ncbi:MAG: hypothetical protein ACYSU7_14780 [Planctomycetota bacterium]|jgi:hypothetical protein
MIQDALSLLAILAGTHVVSPSIEEDVKRHFSLHRSALASGVDPSPSIEEDVKRHFSLHRSALASGVDPSPNR